MRLIARALRALWFTRPSQSAPDSLSEEALSLAKTLHRKGEFGDAERLYRDFLAAFPGHAEATHFLGLLVVDIGHRNEGLAMIRESVRLDPGNGTFLSNLGLVLQQAGDLAAAEDALQRAVAVAPEQADAHFNLGNVLRQRRPDSDYEAAYRRAIELQPDHASALNNLAVLLQQRGDFAAAEVAYRRAAGLDPANAGALVNLGGVLVSQGRIEEAEATYLRCLEPQPGNVEAHFGLASTLLLAGRFAEGWAHYEYRPGRRPPTSLAHIPSWRGEPLEGRRLLVYGEQGLGDTIMFARFLTALKRLGATVALRCQPPLVRLLSKMSCVDGVGTLDSATPSPIADYAVPLMSLPYRLGLKLPQLATEVPYLDAVAALPPAWADRFPSGDLRPRVGVVWAGNPAHANDANRSIALELLRPILNRDSIAWYSLQKGIPTSDLPAGVVDWMSDCADFEDTRVLVAQLDLVVTVDTAVAHLAGAMGKPVLLLAPQTLCWRWQIDGVESPWYPATKVIRQRQVGSWGAEIEMAATLLDQWVAGGRFRKPERSESL